MLFWIECNYCLKLSFLPSQFFLTFYLIRMFICSLLYVFYLLFKPFTPGKHRRFNLSLGYCAYIDRMIIASMFFLKIFYLLFLLFLQLLIEPLYLYLSHNENKFGFNNTIEIVVVLFDHFLRPQIWNCTADNFFYPIIRKSVTISPLCCRQV